MTVAVAKSSLPADVSLRKTSYDEFRVAFKGRGHEDSAYYTNDLRDAVNTAWAMHWQAATAAGGQL